MKIAVVGSKGMLGSDLVRLLGEQKDAVAQEYDLPALDITTRFADENAVAPCDCLVNCAAYTNVDGAESNKGEAFKINCDGAQRVAEWCATNKIYLIHLSTDYVFDGKSKCPYTETDQPAPLNVYGKSKLAGENAVREKCPDSLIVRTQSLFGLHGRNFVATIMKKLAAGEPLRVVNDQVSCPTYTRHLADAILRLIPLKKQGIVNVSSEGKCSWFEFARAIAAKVKPGADVKPVTTAEFPSPAKRPAYSVLDKTLYRSWTGRTMPSWEKALDDYLGEERNRPSVGLRAGR